LGKYSTGIDWSAVMAMASAIEELHSCRIVFRLTTGGQGHNGGMQIELGATFDVVPGSDLPKAVIVSHHWPSKTATTLQGLMYNLCWQLDYAIQKEYEQLPLRGT
jgi:hypothetical protein